MIICEKPGELFQQLEIPAERNLSVGFVPTMGALHEGHLSLIDTCTTENNFTVVSIFINPKQFNDEKDFKTYPRDNARDLGLLQEKGNIDLVFLPTPEDMYPEHAEVMVDPGVMAHKLCGMSRQGHFRGVLTIVNKLFNMISPDTAYFGAKDFQQFILISKMVEDFNMKTRLRMCPTIREEDGLAMSSRNVHLSSSERDEAPSLFQALEMGYHQIKKGERSSLLVIEKMMTHVLENTHFEIDYLSIVNPADLEDLSEVDPKNPFIIAAAACLGSTRLIDNIFHIP